MADENYGIKYVVIAVGDPSMRATDEDVQAVVAAVAPFNGIVLDGIDADRLSVALLRKMGVMP